VFFGRLVVITSGGVLSGLFIYAGQPGPGNPPVLSAVAPGVTQDPYHNPVSAVLNIGNQSAAHAGFDASGIEYLSDSSGHIRITIDPGRQFEGFYAAPGLFNGGQLLLSASPAGGTDQASNAFLAGYATYGPGPAFAIAQLNNGMLSLQFGTSVLPATLFTTAAQKAVTLDAPTTLANDVQGFIELESAVTGFFPVVITNAIIHEQDPATPGLTETWHLFNLTAGWTVGTDSNGTSYPPAYMLLPDGAVAIRGCIITPAAGSAVGVAFNSTNLIAPYVPAGGSNIPTATVAQASGAHVGTVEIHPNGNVELQGSFTTSNNVRLDSTVRVI
jgi:hypothetical protein